MCGVAGIIGLPADGDLKNRLEAMGDSLAHRGPDGSGVWAKGEAGFSHKRLSIFDLTSNGAQPMHSACGRYTIVYNGEIYNWIEIRDLLEFSNWKSRTDTETVLQAYVEKGSECLKLFNGMFAFCIWDSRKKQLFMARDRVGIKPLFYGIHNGGLYFASETKAMFAGGFPKVANRKTLYDFLRWGLIDHDEKSFFEGIKSILPGNYILYSQDKGISEHVYWDLPKIISENEQGLISPEDAIEEYTYLLKDSVKLRVRADVPVGTMLSGGIDSSVLTSFVNENLGQRYPSSYTYDYSEEQGESIRAKQVSDALGIPWNLVKLSHDEVPDGMRRLIRIHESPITSMVILAHHKAYDLAHTNGLKILIEGQGGDELGAGYEYYYMPYVIDLLRNANGADSLSIMNKFMDKFKIPDSQRMQRLLDTLQTSLRPGISTHDGLSFVNVDCLNQNFLNEFNGYEPGIEKLSDSFLKNLQYADYRAVVLPRALRYADRASMSSSLEARVPILDHRIVEMSFKTSIDACINNYQQRYFMCKAAENILPAKILNRPKVTIVDPQRHWLKHELRPWITELFHSPEINELGFFNQKAIIAEYEKFCDQENPRTSFHLFQYINVILWYQEMFSNVGSFC